MPAKVSSNKENDAGSYTANMHHRGRAVAAANAAKVVTTKPLATKASRSTGQPRKFSGYASMLPLSASPPDDTATATEGSVTERANPPKPAATATEGSVTERAYPPKPAATATQGSLTERAKCVVAGANDAGITYAEILKAATLPFTPRSHDPMTHRHPLPTFKTPVVPPLRLGNLDSNLYVPTPALSSQYMPTPALSSQTARTPDTGSIRVAGAHLQPLLYRDSDSGWAKPAELEAQGMDCSQGEETTQMQLESVNARNASLTSEVARLKSQLEKAEQEKRAAIHSERKAQEAHLDLVNAHSRTEDDVVTARKGAKKLQDQLQAVSFVSKQLAAAMEVQTQQVAGALYAFATVFEEYHATVDVAATASQADCATPPPRTPSSPQALDGIMPSPTLRNTPNARDPSFLLQQLELRDHLVGGLAVAAERLEGALFKGHSSCKDFSSKLLMLSGDVEGTDCSATPQRS